jgi:hypothetical protein
MNNVSVFIDIEAKFKENESLVLTISKFENDTMSVFYSNDKIYEDIEFTLEGQIVSTSIMDKEQYVMLPRKDYPSLYHNKIPLHILQYETEIKNKLKNYVNVSLR